jgi:hypothetical protein
MNKRQLYTCGSWGIINKPITINRNEILLENREDLKRWNWDINNKAEIKNSQLRWFGHVCRMENKYGRQDNMEESLEQRCVPVLQCR